MMKTLILFGAEASYGSDNSGIPPLGNNLFSELARFNPPGWGSLSIEYRNTFNDDFEQGMQKIKTLLLGFIALRLRLRSNTPNRLNQNVL
jgi:hypothetical protein